MSSPAWWVWLAMEVSKPLRVNAALRWLVKVFAVSLRLKLRNTSQLVLAGGVEAIGLLLHARCSYGGIKRGIKYGSEYIKSHAHQKG